MKGRSGRPKSTPAAARNGSPADVAKESPFSAVAKENSSFPAAARE